MDQQVATKSLSQATDRFLRCAATSLESGVPGRFHRYDIQDIASARDDTDWVPYLLRVRPAGATRGDIYGKGHLLDLPGLRIDYVEGKASFDAELGADPDRLTIRYLIHGTLTYFLGSSVIAEMKPGDTICRLNKSPLLRYRASADYASLVIATSVSRAPLGPASPSAQHSGPAFEAGLVQLGQPDFWQANLAYVLNLAVDLFNAADTAAPVALLSEFLFLLCASELTAHSRNAQANSPYRTIPPKLAMAETFAVRNAARSPSVEEVAAAAGLTVRNLHKLFLKHRGVSSSKFIQEVRLEGVRRALDGAGPNATVSEIANAWTFDNLGTFAGIYKRRFGELPSYTLKNGLARTVRSQLSADAGIQRSDAMIHDPSEPIPERQAAATIMKASSPLHEAIGHFVSTAKRNATEVGSPYRHFINDTLEDAQAASDHSPHQIAVRRSSALPAFSSETVILNAGALRFEHVSARAALDFDVSHAPDRLSIRYIARGNHALLVDDRVIVDTQAGDYAFRFTKSPRFRVTTSDEYEALFVSFPIPTARLFSIGYQEQINSRLRQYLEHGYMLVSQSYRWGTHLAFALDYAVRYSRSHDDPRTPIVVEFLYLLCAQELIDQSHARGGNKRPTIVPFKLKVAERFIAATAASSPSVEEVAVASDLSGRSLHQLFIRFHGVAPLDFIIEQRLLGVRRALETAEDHETVGTIAEAWHYRNLGYFSAAYKKRFGELPSETLATRRSTSTLKSEKPS